MKATLKAFLALTPLFLPALTASAEPDLKRITDHIHKSFSTPSSVRLKIEGLKPGRLPGYLTGTLTLTAGERKQVQPIHVSKKGSLYFIGPVFDVIDSNVAGFKRLQGVGGLPPPPDIHLTKDGSLAIVGSPKNFSIDPDKETLSKMKLTNVPYSGPKNAPVTIVEYSDLQCTHCKKAHEILRKELPAYKGKVKRVFKHYPLPGHPWAFNAAIAVTCAEKIKPRTTFSLKSDIFDNQASITLANLRDKIAGMAEKKGVDRKRFLRCFDKKETKPLVEADIREGDRVGVTGTPAIFINGRRSRGYSFNSIKDILDEYISKG